MIKMPEQEKEWSKRRAENLAEDLDILLGDLCVVWGFCGGLTGWELTHEGKTITAADFAQAVVASEEDMDSHTAASWLPRISDAFVQRHGPSVSAKDFGPA